MYDGNMGDMSILDSPLLRGYEDIFERLTLLERRSNLTPLDFGPFQLPEDHPSRIKACCELAKWRLKRLEALA
jgi:hypothetical protein